MAPGANEPARLDPRVKTMHRVVPNSGLDRLTGSKWWSFESWCAAGEQHVVVTSLT
jgi:hypothetical protein